jgi:hypothetical protein
VKDHEVDYLVVGAGAMGMAFTDVLMTESDATVALVDRYHQPGGHWNVAYPFVRLHQPSSFYGVNSRALGEDRIDTAGLNSGLYELASKSEICAYYDNVMRDFISSGRVRYFPMYEYQDNGQITSLVSGASHKITARRTVDATYMNVRVPAMGEPSYDVAAGVRCVPPNALAGLQGEWERYVVIGAGKTGIDACLFLLENGASPDSICWIKPRDSWLWDRARAQSGDLFEKSIRPFALGQIIAAAESKSVDDLFDRASAAGLLLRIDDDIRPTMFRCATVTRSEIAQLKRIGDVVRMGRVQRIEPGRVVLDKGSFETGPATLYIDCTADGLASRPPLPVFDNNRITLQSVRTCQQVFSAAFIAHVEITEPDEARKNLLCKPVPHPDTDTDYLRNQLADLANGAVWAQDDALMAWLKAARLDGWTYPGTSAESDAQFNARIEKAGAIAAEKLLGYLTASQD